MRAAILVLMAGICTLTLEGRAQGGSPTLVRSDRLCADLLTPANDRCASVYDRTVSIARTGEYVVRITGPHGIMRLEGQYADAALTIPVGHFTYYHINGRKESSGDYMEGEKAGVWQCWAMDGSPRPDRMYAGKPWEQLQFDVGVSEIARTSVRPIGVSEVR